MPSGRFSKGRPSLTNRREPTLPFFRNARDVLWKAVFLACGRFGKRVPNRVVRQF